MAVSYTHLDVYKRQVLEEAADDHLVKGEALVAHVRGRGKTARVVAAERQLPLL